MLLHTNGKFTRILRHSLSIFRCMSKLRYKNNLNENKNCYCPIEGPQGAKSLQ